MQQPSYRIVWTRDQTLHERRSLGSGKMPEVEIVQRPCRDQAVAYGVQIAGERGWTFIAADPVAQVEVINAQYA